MRERRKTLPPKLRQATDAITNAIQEARKIREIAIQEEVVAQLDKVTQSMEKAKKEITRIMKM